MQSLNVPCLSSVVTQMLARHDGVLVRMAGPDFFRELKEAGIPGSESR